MPQRASNPPLLGYWAEGAEAGEAVVKANQSKSNGNLRAGKLRADQNVLDEESLHRMISLERKRAERSGKPFLLMLLEMRDGLASEKKGKILHKVFSALFQNTRETDVMGWYRTNSVVGVMFTELGLDDRGSILSTVMNKSRETLSQSVSPEHFERINISFHLYPQDAKHNIPKRPSASAVNAVLPGREAGNKLFRATKRLMIASMRLGS